MEESVETAITLIKECVKKYNGIDENFFDKNEFHISMGGSSPKDGPSAGAATFIALLSAVSKTMPIENFAMTGEISLLGELKSIGGLEAKLVAAHVIRSKIVCIPLGNLHDIYPLPSGIIHRDSLDFAKKNLLNKMKEELMIQSNK